MADTLIEILTILMQYLKQDFKAAEVAFRIQNVEGNKTIFLPILSTTGLTNLRMVTCPFCFQSYNDGYKF